MANLAPIRRRLQWVIAALVFVDLLIGAYLLSPSGRSHVRREEEYSRLQNELELKKKQLEPLRGIDKKLIEAKRDIAGFYDLRLPAETSVISATLGQLAQRNTVKLSNVTYQYEAGDVPDLLRVRISARLSGDYPRVVRYINSIERSQIVFLLDTISLSEEQGGKVSLQLTLETYLHQS